MRAERMPSTGQAPGPERGPCSLDRWFTKRGRGPLRGLIPATLLWAFACGGAPGGEGGAGPSQSLDELRVVHARALAAPPTLSDLEGETRLVAEACVGDPVGARCLEGGAALPAPAWALVQEVVAGRDRHAAEVEEQLEMCRANDEPTFLAAFPGRAAFLEQVATPPAFREERVDAVVVIGLGSGLLPRALRVLERGMAREVLKVQLRSPGTPSEFAPEPGDSMSTPGVFPGFFTPDIQERMQAPRPDCDRFRSTALIQGACRRDLTVSIVRDWVEARGHRSIRIILDQQTSWPEYDLLFQRMMPGVERHFDPDFDLRLSRSSSFISEMCGIVATEELWPDYRFYVRTLFAD